MYMHVEHLKEIQWTSFTRSLKPRKEEKVAAIANEDMPAKAKAKTDGTSEPNAALVFAEAATCFMGPTQPHQWCVRPATVKFHALLLAPHKINQVQHQNQFAGL